MIDIKAKEIEILEGLKDFQRATVDRCFEVFRSGQNRILVADEVGLGKTLVAKGLIARLASWHKDEKADNLFKVVYICSNQSIASQNIQKLYNGATVDGVSDTRLSMQHLKIFEQENDEKVLEKYLSDNVSQYAKVNEKGEIEIEIEKYIELQYEYLKNTAKINLATSRVDFVKSSDGWRVIEQNQKK